jgi:hypothetical protein
MHGLTDWFGNIEQFAQKVAQISARLGAPDDGEPSIRMIRDYLQRGILGKTAKSGREIVFGYANLVRYLTARALLRDGWPLSKIGQHFDISTLAELEALVPGLENRAGAARQSIKNTSQTAQGSTEPQAAFSKRTARITGIQAEMRDAMARLGLPHHGMATEQLTLFALAPWCQVLINTDRLSHITIEEAEELGHGLTAGLLDVVTRKGRGDD